MRRGSREHADGVIAAGQSGTTGERVAAERDISGRSGDRAYDFSICDVAALESPVLRTALNTAENWV